MQDITKTIKLHIHTDENVSSLFKELTMRYCDACNYISEYVFDNEFILNFMDLQKQLYNSIRSSYGLKSQMTISSLKTVTARYKTVNEQLHQHPYKYQDTNGKYIYIPKNIEWLKQPIHFSRPQADFVRGRDYSFVKNGEILSLNTLLKRVEVSFDMPDCFKEYFDGLWKLGTGKLVSLKGEWYFHIPVTKQIKDNFDVSKPAHVVGIDRGLRFLITSYDENGKTTFISGKDIIKKRDSFAVVRAQLQSKRTKSAKRVLKRISGRENRWMSDVNHQVSKTLVNRYGKDTLYVLEDLTDVSFADENLSRGKITNRNLRSWSFYQFEQFLSYKAKESGSDMIKVSAKYTSQRCPKCGRIHKKNRDHDKHLYICDSCGYRSNDDRIGAMNIYNLGTLYVSGDSNPRYGKQKTE